MNKQQRAHKNLIQAQRNWGSNCEGRDQEFSGSALPSEREARKLCRGCPLVGPDGPCRAYAVANKGQVHGVYDSQVFDPWGDLEGDLDEERQ